MGAIQTPFYYYSITEENSRNTDYQRTITLRRAESMLDVLIKDLWQLSALGREVHHSYIHMVPHSGEECQKYRSAADDNGSAHMEENITQRRYN